MGNALCSTRTWDEALLFTQSAVVAKPVASRGIRAEAVAAAVARVFLPRKDTAACTCFQNANLKKQKGGYCRLF